MSVATALKKFLLPWSGSARAQRVLERLDRTIQDLMGIGSGGSPDSSGERAIIRMLLEQHGRSRDRELCIFDAGANKGQFLSMLLDGLANVPFRVHAFEPGASAFHALAAEHRHRPQVTLNQLGLGKEPGALTLYSDEEGSGLASVYPRRLDHFGIAFSRREQVPMETIDRYCERGGIRRIDLLKIDVEGHELDVLHGASRLLASGAIETITFEFGGCNIDSRTFFQDFFYFFQSYGSYRLFRLTPSGYLAPIDTYREIYEQFRTTNFVARRLTS